MKTKRLFSLLILAILLPLAALADEWQDPETKINYTYTVGSGEAEVKAGDARYTYAPGSSVKGNVNILSSFTVDGKEYTVTSIGTCAFQGLNLLTGITIPSSVTAIKSDAFARAGLTSVTIPSSVTYIGASAFYSCTSLSNVTIQDGVNKILEYAFQKCTSLTSITIPASVKIIEHSAFAECTSLSDITIQDGVDEIEEWAFYKTAWMNNQPNGPLYIDNWLIYYKGEVSDLQIKEGTKSIADGAMSINRNLTSVTIPSSVTYIGSSAFHSCESLSAVNINDLAAWCGIDFVSDESNPLYYAKHLFLNGEEITDLKIPEEITSIKRYAFYNCNGLTSVTIPDYVTSIGSCAFSGCSGLTSVTIPEGVTSIGNSAFYNCSSLTNVNIPESVTEVSSYAYYGTGWYNSQPDGLVYLDNWLLGYKGEEPTGELIIEEGTRGIAPTSFYGCSNLTSVTIPSDVTFIGSSTFYGCSGLTSITIPSSVTFIGSYTFYGCSGLTTITIPNSVTSIENYAFSGCSGLTSATIPANVTSIGTSAFAGCKSLNSVTSLIHEPFEISKNVFQYNDNGYKFTSATLYVPKGTKEKYESTPAWNQFQSIIEMTDEDTAIDNAIIHNGKAAVTERYNLSGQRVTGQQKGMYIQNGKKYIAQ